LIVMGTHGRTGVAHLLMGSVAEHLIRKAPCPVLVARTPLPVSQDTRQNIVKPSQPVRGARSARGQLQWTSEIRWKNNGLIPRIIRR
jgi:hypothetical protein